MEKDDVTQMSGETPEHRHSAHSLVSSHHFLQPSQNSFCLRSNASNAVCAGKPASSLEKKKKKKRKTKIRICTICQFPRCKHSHHGRFQLTGGLTADSQHFRIFNNQLLQTRRGQLQHVLNSPAPENPQITPRADCVWKNRTHIIYISCYQELILPKLVSHLSSYHLCLADQHRANWESCRLMKAFETKKSNRALNRNEKSKGGHPAKWPPASVLPLMAPCDLARVLGGGRGP
ncbi:uncharacterized protein LOC122222542 [Panthera leo]|uniref:uncharacterized protein LOC122222542 n=1 Tax=Panthera leo TaxID=9689 RepID=UPI001C6A3E40|nr:uncharacterized protein LOC122222542 [Panthera leo]